MILVGRFHAKAGRETEAEAALGEVVVPTRKEQGCLSIEVSRSKSDLRLFFIYSRWKDETAFEGHTNQPHTMKFVKTMEGLIDHPWDTTRAQVIA
jgi:quinol monooxygenase YgiN